MVNRWLNVGLEVSSVEAIVTLARIDGLFAPKKRQIFLIWTTLNCFEISNFSVLANILRSHLTSLSVDITITRMVYTGACASCGRTRHHSTAFTARPEGRPISEHPLIDVNLENPENDRWCEPCYQKDRRLQCVFTCFAFNHHQLL